MSAPGMTLHEAERRAAMWSPAAFGHRLPPALRSLTPRPPWWRLAARRRWQLAERIARLERELGLD